MKTPYVKSKSKFVFAATGFAIGILGAVFLYEVHSHQSYFLNLLARTLGYVEELPAGNSEPDPGFDLRPHPRYTAKQVVQHQLFALERSPADEMYLQVCYRFASPANRASCGPFPRFARMIRSDYRSLVGHQLAMIGDERCQGDVASVVVSGFGADNLPMCFEFILAKQTSKEFQDCWMTDAVISLKPLDESDPMLAMQLLSDEWQ